MKKMLLMALAVALILPSCTKDDEPEQMTDEGRIELFVNADTMANHATITFGCRTVSQQPMTRSTLESASMTDLWVFDGETLVVHQTSDDTAFGSPSVNVDYGEHHFYFIASRGSDPTVNGKTISWAKLSDTFWQGLTLTIAPQTATTQSVVLQRVAARLRVTVTDEVPSTLASLNVTPSTWYYGLDFTTGEATDSRTTMRTISVPASYAGTSGQLAASFYCISPSEAWTTNITLAAKSSDDATISQISIADVPMQRNHITSYSGSLFTAGRSVDVSADDEWGDDINGTW